MEAANEKLHSPYKMCCPVQREGLMWHRGGGNNVMSIHSLLLAEEVR